MSWKNRRKGSKNTKTTTKKTKSSGGLGGGGSIFAPIDEVDNKQQANSRFTAGDYLLRVKALKAGPSKKEMGINFFAAEFEVVESEGEHALAPETPVSWATLLKNSYAFRDVKNLVAAILDMPEEEITQQQADEAIENDGEALAGELVMCSATENSRGFIDLYFEPAE
ncbi:MAG: hypothetical protein ACF8MF_06660 [Phycisphaerales bacterium JB052]